jgi:CRP-like cAMP-binding protein
MDVLKTFTSVMGAAMDGTQENSVDEQFGFLKKTQIFSPLSTEDLKTVMDGGRMETYSAGSVIFNIGDPADAVYVVKTGVVEICRASGDGNKMSVVAYLGESDPIGETAIITGSPRASMARVPEKVEILIIRKASFMDLLVKIPRLALCLLAIFAKRLERGFREERAEARYRQLSGKLEYFDLPTIIQTLANSSLTGTLTITDKAERVFATLYFEGGRMLNAVAGRLKGKDAFHQLLQSAVLDAFSFKGGPPSKKFDEDSKVTMAPMALLLESSRQQDELKVLKQRYPDPKRVFRPKLEAFTWDDKETLALAEEIWVHLKLGQSIDRMVSEIPTCEYRIYKVLYIMDGHGWIV